MFQIMKRQRASFEATDRMDMVAEDSPTVTEHGDAGSNMQHLQTSAYVGKNALLQEMAGKTQIPPGKKDRIAAGPKKLEERIDFRRKLYIFWGN